MAGKKIDFTRAIEQLASLDEYYSEGDLTRMFIESSMKRLVEYSKVDVAIVGAGPAGLSAAYILGKEGLKTIVVERMLGVGGGIRGGGMLLPIAILEDGDAKTILEEVGVKIYGLDEGLFYVDPTEAMIKLAAEAINEGVFIWPGVYVEDLITSMEGESIKVRGIVINWSPIIESKLHIDPLMIESKAVIDATGHDADVVRILSKRYPGLKLEVPGMASMDVWKGEVEVVSRTGPVVKGLYVAGMSVAEVFHSHRMGPVLGGMILSGARAAYQIIDELKKM
ncbi:MAG: ribose 1,5-bisphosphate isomerase [Thermoprotei archaeon]|nr:MAG: ribose 1,5-bisphosphate isomerase [Thermoprotei archaeon]